MEPLKNRWIEIQGYKHDGRMHRIWDSVFVVDESSWTWFQNLVHKRTSNYDIFQK